MAATRPYVVEMHDGKTRVVEDVNVAQVRAHVAMTLIKEVRAAKATDILRLMAGDSAVEIEKAAASEVE